MISDRLKYLQIEHHNPNNWYSKICNKCRKKYKINKVTLPELDEELNYCFECVRKHIHEYLY